MELRDNDDTHIIQPDGYSYIIYTPDKAHSVNYYKPDAIPLILKSKSTNYYIAKCRPTYVGYLKMQNIKMTPAKPNDFLESLSSVKFKSISPTVLDNIVMHLHANENASLTALKKHYQCTHLKINYLFKKNLGMSFQQYKSILKASYTNLNDIFKAQEE
ncbi:hypothetical protein [Formosa sp. 4Alg 33]|uniref:hypothetical protein n=1 Tax=Formosa sp. 4Alg 33 TaxID=3382189 RepID=UPI003D9C4B74